MYSSQNLEFQRDLCNEQPALQNIKLGTSDSRLAIYFKVRNALSRKRTSAWLKDGHFGMGEC